MGKKVDSKEGQSNLLWFFGVSLFVFVGFLMFNSKMGYINDDYTYRFIFENWRISSNPIRVTSLSDIYTSMYNHYMVWGGRIPVHTVVQLFLMVDKIFFNICNSLMVVLLGLLIYFHVQYGKARSLFLFVFINFLLWFFVPAANETLIFLTGSINYLWVSVYVLLFLIPYRIHFDSVATFKHPLFLLFILIPVGFLAGWSSEPGGGAAGLMALMFIIYSIKTRKKAPLWAFSGIISVAVGLSFLVLAPGYRVKANNLYGAQSVLKYALINFDEIFMNVFKQTFISLLPLLLIAFIILLSLFYINKKANNNLKHHNKAYVKNQNVDTIRENTKTLLLFYCVSSVACFAIYLISPEFVIRYLFMTTTLLIITISLFLSELIEKINFKKPRNKRLISLVICAFLVFIVIDGIKQYPILSHNFEKNVIIENEIKSQIEKGENNVILKGEYVIIKGGRFNIYKLGWQPWIFWGKADPDFEINRLMAATYGVDSYINEAEIYYVDAKDHFNR